MYVEAVVGNERARRDAGRADAPVFRPGLLQDDVACAARVTIRVNDNVAYSGERTAEGSLYRASREPRIREGAREDTARRADRHPRIRKPGVSARNCTEV